MGQHSIMEEVICRINPANSDLFARYNLASSFLFSRLIWQIVTYLPDNQDLEKGEAPMIFILNGFYGQKNYRRQCLFFSFYLSPYAEGRYNINEFSNIFWRLLR